MKYEDIKVKIYFHKIMFQKDENQKFLEIRETIPSLFQKEANFNE